MWRPLSLLAFAGIFHSGTFWGAIADDIEAVGILQDFRIFWVDFLAGFISWLFLPAIAAGMFLQFIRVGLFTTVFTIIEIDKPDKPYNFEPQMYNMERSSIWDFNAKYEHVWDFTVEKDDILKR
ncbi:hypothetical protein ACB092_02G087600 [Castanea dentata]